MHGIASGSSSLDSEPLRGDCPEIQIQRRPEAGEMLPAT
jgi:hypothetical protein